MANTVEETARLMGRTHQQRFDRLVPGYHRQLRYAGAQMSDEVEQNLSQSFIALLVKLTLAMVAVALVIFASASYYGSIVAKGGHETDATPRQITIANEVLNVPANMIRFRAQRKSHVLERLDLYAHWPSMQGYSADNANIFDDMEDEEGAAADSVDELPAAPRLGNAVRAAPRLDDPGELDAASGVPPYRVGYLSGTPTECGSGMPATIWWSPSTMFSYIWLRPVTSSDFTVSISCKV